MARMPGNLNSTYIEIQLITIIRMAAFVSTSSSDPFSARLA